MSKWKWGIIVSLLCSAYFYWKINKAFSSLEKSIIEFQIPGEININLSKGEYLLYELIPKGSNIRKDRNWQYQLENNILTNKEIVIKRTAKVKSIGYILKLTVNEKEYTSIKGFEIVSDSRQINIKSTIKSPEIQILAIEKTDDDSFKFIFFNYLGLIIGVITSIIMIIIIIFKK